jgi:hypothetical protein
MAKAGLKVAKKGFCPLLVAENELRKARNKLIETMKPITGIELDDLMRHYPDNYNKYFDLTLRLLAPFVQGVTP